MRHILLSIVSRTNDRICVCLVREGLSLEDAKTGSIPSSKKIFHVPTIPLAMMLKLQKPDPRQVPRSVDVKDLNLNGQQVLYSDNASKCIKIKKGLNEHQNGPHPLKPFEQVEYVMGRHTPMKQKHLEIQKLENALHKRETRKVDIEKQLGMVKNIATARSPPVIVAKVCSTSSIISCPLPTTAQREISQTHDRTTI